MTKAAFPRGRLSAGGRATTAQRLERMKLRPADRRFIKRAKFTYLRGADQKLT